LYVFTTDSPCFRFQKGNFHVIRFDNFVSLIIRFF
jgi:hypothetical protein